MRSDGGQAATLRKETEPVMFSDWETKLQELELDATGREAIRRAIVGLLGRCKAKRCPVSIALARDYLEEKGPGVVRIEAMRWFITRGRYQPKIRKETRRSDCARRDPGLPRPPVATDLGKAPWEHNLIRAIRRRGHSWRTEQTYRQWSWSLARWWSPRPMAELNENALRDFLSHLAVERALGPASQKQALNAVAFLWREGLGRSAGEFSDFVRARPKTRLPVVLSREECRALLAALDGIMALIARLMYGTGLRVLETLRLRVQEIDMARGQITVRSGKGRVEAAPTRFDSGVSIGVNIFNKCVLCVCAAF